MVSLFMIDVLVIVSVIVFTGSVDHKIEAPKSEERRRATLLDLRSQICPSLLVGELHLVRQSYLRTQASGFLSVVNTA